MAVAVVAFIGTKAVDAESTTGWNTGNLDNDIFVENAGSVGAKVSATTGDFYDNNSLNHDFSSGGTEEGDHIFAWFNTLTPVSLHAIIAMEDQATDSVACWNVGPPTGYGGGWISYVIDPATDFDTIIASGTAAWVTTGNPAQLHNVDGYGGRHTTTTSIMGNFNNALVDAISVGTGYRITRGDAGSAEATFADIISYEQTTANRFGALRTDGGVLFMLSKIIIGDTTANSHEFTDSNFTVVWLDAPVASTFYEISCEEGSGTTTVILDNGVFKAEDTAQAGKPLIDMSGITSATLNNVSVVGGRGITLDGNVTWNDSTWQDTGQIDLGGQPTLSGITILDPTDDGAMLVNAANELANVSDIVFDGAGIGGTTADAAIEVDISGAGPFTLDFDNITFQNRVAGSVDVHILANGNADYTINVLNGGSTPTVTNDGTGTVTVQNTVTLTVTVKDAADLSVVQNARVRVEAAAGGDLQEEATVTITRSGSVATVALTSHKVPDGSSVIIRGAEQDEYNGVFTVTGVTANDFTYTVGGTPDTPATGTISAATQIMSGLTNASGVLQDTSFNFTNPQPVTGVVRKSTASPYFKTGTVSGTIQSTGFSTEVILIRDE
ncbi:MAG: hypothetical protein R3268_00130 [Acidiferrobacterales bacterium]|nr:hypothetical protein [Acidiferrobacterales bacterium]